ncbi:MAG: iron response transcriptional regulator IrrA [Pseudomonadota bacterium]
MTVSKLQAPAKSGCPTSNIPQMLRGAGLRPTRQRVGLAVLLFSRGNRHVSAEQMFEEASAANMPISLATVYNTLHQFTAAGLMRAVAVDSAKTYFDTNTSDHHHFYHEDSGQVVDVHDADMQVVGLPDIPDGMELSRVEVIVRLKRKEARN